MRVWLGLALGLAACGPEGNSHGKGGMDTGTLPSTGGPGTGTPGGTPTAGTTAGTPTGTPGGTTAITSTISGDCTNTSNPLRFSCDLVVDPPQPVDVTFWIQGTTDEYTLSSEAVAAQQNVLLYLLKADTVYEWRATPRFDPATEITGSFTTGTLSGGCMVDATINGTSSVPYIITQSPCVTDANIVVLDRDGDVVWCEDFRPGGLDPMMEGYSFTEDGTLIAVVADTIIEKDFAGNELLRLERGTDFAQHVHHDVFRKNGLTYVLFNEQVNLPAGVFTLDGFHVFDGQNHLGEWHLADHFQPSTAPVGWPGQDYSHANSLWVDDYGEMLISFRHMSAFAAVVADPYDPAFGEITWRAAGIPGTEFGSDYAITSSVGGSTDFERQHNVHYLPTGELVMFDNRDGIGELSRLLHFAVDPVSATMDIQAIYELPMHCDFQGGALHTPAGNPIATCAPLRKGFEWDAANPTTPRWDMTLSCSNNLNTYTPRFTPWEGPF